MIMKEKDFIEIEFTGKVKEGEIFDSNIKEDLKKAGIDVKAEPFIFCLGEGMFLKGVENFLIGKDIGRYNIELSVENAFGKRNPKLIRLMPVKVFREHQVNPIQGARFNFDGRVGKILSVAGGRIMVDFNNPIAGKDVEYNVNVKRVIDDKKEQIKAFIDFLFKKDFKFEVKDKKLVIDAEKGYKQFVEMFKDKFKGLFDLELEVKEVDEEKVGENKKDSESPKSSQ